MSSKTIPYSFGPTICLKNEFDEIFLQEKDKALSPIFLDDKVVNNEGSEPKNDPKKESLLPLPLSSETDSLDIKKAKKGKTKKPKKLKNSNKKIKRANTNELYESNIVIVESKEEDEDKEEDVCPIAKEFSKIAKKIKVVQPKGRSKRSMNSH